MAITTAICSSFRREILVGMHNLTASTGDVFKLALYTSVATLGAATTQWTGGDVTGPGYTSGGVVLTNITPFLSGTVACVDFQDVTIPAATITARGCLIYNSSKPDNRAMSAHDFGADKTSSGGDFIITFPTPDASNAIVRI